MNGNLPEHIMTLKTSAQVENGAWILSDTSKHKTKSDRKKYPRPTKLLSTVVAPCIVMLSSTVTYRSKIFPSYC